MNTSAGPLLAWTWILLGLVAVLLGARFDRLTLRAHSAVWLALAVAIGRRFHRMIGPPS